MPIITPNVSLLCGLAGELDPNRLDYLPPDEALARLVAKFGEDFGYDVRRWQEWMIANGHLQSWECRPTGERLEN